MPYSKSNLVESRMLVTHMMLWKKKQIVLAMEREIMNFKTQSHTAVQNLENMYKYVTSIWLWFNFANKITYLIYLISINILAFVRNQVNCLFVFLHKEKSLSSEKKFFQLLYKIMWNLILHWIISKLWKNK
jgi:hypothetical protein